MQYVTKLCPGVSDICLIPDVTQLCLRDVTSSRGDIGNSPADAQGCSVSVCEIYGSKERLVRPEDTILLWQDATVYLIPQESHNRNTNEVRDFRATWSLNVSAIHIVQN